jgi:hypothetical protein
LDKPAPVHRDSSYPIDLTVYGMKVQQFLAFAILSLSGTTSAETIPSWLNSAMDEAQIAAADWKVHCRADACLLANYDVLIGDPDHPVDPLHPKFMAIAVALYRPSGKAGYISFHLQDQLDPSAGLIVTFSKTVKIGRSWGTKLDQDGAFEIPLEKCVPAECIATAADGMALQLKTGKSVDLLPNFLSESHILFLYFKHGAPYRAIFMLKPFENFYRRVQSGDFDPAK